MTDSKQTLDDLIALNDTEVAALSTETIGRAVVRAMATYELEDLANEERSEGIQFLLDSQDGKLLVMQMTVAVQTVLASAEPRARVAPRTCSADAARLAREDLWGWSTTMTHREDRAPAVQR
jgi:hypothetical protein